MIVGDASGNIHLFSNIAAIGAPASFVLTTPNYLGINVGSNATPQLVDVDRDGQIDLLLGERNGNINYYHNNGGVVFAFVTANFGGVNVRKLNSFAGFSVPYLFDNGSGYELLVGSLSGYLYHYNNIDGNLTGNFNLADSMFQNIFEPQRSFPAAADVDADGKYDLVVGNACGGVVLYTQNSLLSLNNSQGNSMVDFSVYPNPSNDAFTLELKEFNHLESAYLTITDFAGRTIYSEKIATSIITISNEILNPGIYICQIKVGQSLFAKKIFKL